MNSILILEFYIDIVRESITISTMEENQDQNWFEDSQPVPEEFQ